MTVLRFHVNDELVEVDDVSPTLTVLEFLRRHHRATRSARQVGTLLGVAPYRVTVKDVIPGSVIVQFTVAPHPTTGVSLSTAVVLATFGSAGVAVAGVPLPRARVEPTSRTTEYCRG